MYTNQTQSLLMRCIVFFSRSPTLWVRASLDLFRQKSHDKRSPFLKVFGDRRHQTFSESKPEIRSSVHEHQMQNSPSTDYSSNLFSLTSGVHSLLNFTASFNTLNIPTFITSTLGTHQKNKKEINKTHATMNVRSTKSTFFYLTRHETSFQNSFNVYRMSFDDFIQVCGLQRYRYINFCHSGQDILRNPTPLLFLSMKKAHNILYSTPLQTQVYCVKSKNKQLSLCIDFLMQNGSVSILFQTAHPYRCSTIFSKHKIFFNFCCDFLAFLQQKLQV